MFSQIPTRWSRHWTNSATLATDAPSCASRIGGITESRTDAAVELARAWSRVRRSRPLLYGMTLAAAGVVACAGTPHQATSAMTRAEDAIEQAKRAGAGQLASHPLQEAQQQLEHAREAAQRHDERHADGFADEAYANARLAELTAQNATATKQAAEVDKGIRTLESETTRSPTP